MIYRNSNIPNNFNRIAEYSDNYIVWVKDSKLYNNRTYEAYIQYFKPNFYYIYLDNYSIKNGTNYTITPNYSNNGMYSYITDYDLTYELNTTQLVSGDDFNSTIEYISDYNEVHVSVFCLMIVIVWVFNHISKLWCKGGCFK